MKRPSITDVARRLNLSKTTVSRVFNDAPNAGISQATRERVLKAIRDMGYEPNLSARALATGQTHVIGVVSINSSNPFSSDMIWSMESVAKEHGFHVILCNTRGDPKAEYEESHMLRQRGVEGLILEHLGPAEPIRDLIDSGYPLVFLDRCDGAPEVDYVTFDDVEGGRLATQALINTGRKKIAHIAGPQSSLPARDRLAGYRKAMQEAGLTIDPNWIIEAPRFEDVDVGRLAALQLLDLRNRPEAIVCPCDFLALGVFQAAVARNIKVPDDLAIIGYNDQSFCPWTAVPLSSIRLDFKQLGERATRLLLDKIEGKSSAGSGNALKITPQVVMRSSV